MKGPGIAGSVDPTERRPLRILTAKITATKSDTGSEQLTSTTIITSNQEPVRGQATQLHVLEQITGATEAPNLEISIALAEPVRPISVEEQRIKIAKQQIEEDRRKILIRLRNDPETKAFFIERGRPEDLKIEEHSKFKLSGGISCELRTAAIDTAKDGPAMTLPEDRYRELDFGLILNDSHGQRAIRVYTPIGYSSDRDSEIGTLLVKFMRYLRTGLEVEGGVSVGGRGYGLIHSLERHCKHKLDPKVLMKKEYYSSATQFLRPLEAVDLLGVLRMATQNIKAFEVRPDKNGKGSISIYAGVPEYLGLGCNLIEIGFNVEDGRLITAAPCNTGGCPMLRLFEYDTETKKFKVNEQGNLIIPKERQIITNLNQYKPALVSPSNRLWTFKDTVKAHKEFVDFWDDVVTVRSLEFWNKTLESYRDIN